eukprot:766225-Rhodomonas_salina.4
MSSFPWFFNINHEAQAQKDDATQQNAATRQRRHRYLHVLAVLDEEAQQAERSGTLGTLARRTGTSGARASGPSATRRPEIQVAGTQPTDRAARESAGAPVPAVV